MEPVANDITIFVICSKDLEGKKQKAKKRWSDYRGL